MKVSQMLVFVVLGFAASSTAEMCQEEPVDDVILSDMNDDCTKKMMGQIGEEWKAALSYLTLATHFARDKVNRPGFAKMFFESASEEREHAIKLIDYLLMRGELTDKLHTIIGTPVLQNFNIKNGVSAMTIALTLEQQVTKNITDVIKECEAPKKKKSENDYHLVDYLTGEFLDEQYKGQREIAGKLVTLKKMEDTYGNLGEFLFDKQLLGEGISVV